ncbi:MAG: type III-A CRISPR-associated protein Csm2 [Magnetococcales bacterium]|nr:type III-A CRISPR-associated protein Csm2 [Magnetococcales bacterium]
MDGLLKKITFAPIDVDLFDGTAKAVAEVLSKPSKDKLNKSTQLRRFYDEICLWDEKVVADVSKFDDMLPFIRMLNAKAAYAKGRELVDDNFVRLMRSCLGQVTNTQTMQHFKLFMEAVMGFYKELRPN